MGMNVLLIDAPYREVYSKVSTALGCSPPIGVAYTAAYLRAHNVNVKILDTNALQIGVNEIDKYLKEKFDVIGISSMTPSLINAARILEKAKEANPSVKTVLGGFHVSAVPAETLQEYPSIDFGVIGEGEQTFLGLVQAIEKGKDFSEVDGIVFRKKNETKITKRRALIQNLDELPFPAYDLLPMEKYRLTAHHTNFDKKIKLNPFSLLMTSRGCPFNCTYCASKVIWGRRVRYRSAEKTLEEIDLLVKKYGIKCLDICDDNFTLNKPRLHQILDGLIERDYDLHFNCLSRVDIVDRGSLEKLKKAGCYLIRFGIESGSQEILNAMKKEATVTQTKATFKLMHEVGIPAAASTIIGHPGETRETFNKTLKLVKEIDPVAAHFFIAVPIVGTELFEIAKKNKLIVNPDWRNWVLMPETPVLRTEELSPEDLVKLRSEAYKRFYLRPKFLLKTLLRIRTWGQFKLQFNAFVAVLGLLVNKDKKENTDKVF